MDWSNYEFSLKNWSIGDTPTVFYLEVLIRTTLLYLFALILVRFLGKRGVGQLTPIEFVVLISMGSALGDPMFYPDVALSPPMLVLITIIVLHRSVSLATQKRKRLETLVEGEGAVLLRDGKIVKEAMESECVSFDELCMLLRQQGIENLATVRFAALEPSGQLSVFVYNDGNRSGLPLEALLSESGVERFSPNANFHQTGEYACLGCGTLQSFAAGQSFVACEQCPDEDWVVGRPA